MKIWGDASFIFNHLEVYFQSRLAICAIRAPLNFPNFIVDSMQSLSMAE